MEENREESNMLSQNEKKVMLVTGASGFLGSRICAYFKDKYHIIAPAHGDMDITEERSVETLFAKEKPEIVIHCVAISDVEECEEDLEKSYAINVKGAENLAKLCLLYKTKMVFCSSDQIYFGGEVTIINNQPVPHREDDEVLPCNTYGRQKLEAEKRILTICEDAVCLRLGWMYDKEKNSEKEHGTFYYNVKNLLKKGEVCRFPIHDYRGITYVGAVLENLEKVFTLPGGVYNYGAPNTMCTYETVYRLFKQCGIDAKYIEANEQAFVPNTRNITMSMEKVEKYGIHFEDTLTELIKRW